MLFNSYPSSDFVQERAATVRRAARRKLPARSVYVTASGTPHIRIHSLGFENLFEALYPLPRGRAIGQRLSRVVRNQINFNARLPMTIKKVSQLSSLFVRIVHAVQHHVLERE